ncbi:hypothetical protein F4777DRAFT_528247 [Nemania sp. FL0916]|nr:hypothetical protein F4777DRAFT_528247 [Nemania sp. FL0916]
MISSPRVPPIATQPTSMSEFVDRPGTAPRPNSPVAGTQPRIADLADLPLEIFLQVITYISPTESILCRRVSRSWNAAFTGHDASRHLMRLHFPRVNAVRSADRQYEAHVFYTVARRYFHLRAARPRLIEKIDASITMAAELDGSYMSIRLWDRWLHQNSEKGIFDQGDTSWCLDDGLLVYREGGASCGYVAYDLETGHHIPVPFTTQGTIVRRLRLAHQVLIIEWCQDSPPLAFNDTQTVRRHHATAFDVQRPREWDPSSSLAPWEIRAKWEIRLPSLLMNIYDRFFSAHTATHYALYIWHDAKWPSNRQWAPDESLTIWEFDRASPGIPSENPLGVEMHPQPRIIRRFSQERLSVFGVCQGPNPLLRGIYLDEGNVYIHEEDHCWLIGGEQSSIRLPRGHAVCSTAIPFTAIGPHWFDECCGNRDRVNNRRNSNLRVCPRIGSAARRKAEDYQDDDSGGDGLTGSWLNHPTWPGWAPCWRHDEFPLLTSSRIVDAHTGVSIIARSWPLREPELSTLGRHQLTVQIPQDGPREKTFKTKGLLKHLLGRGVIQGDERWIVGEDRKGAITIVYF